MNLYIWGRGKYINDVLSAIKKETCTNIVIIDNDPQKQGQYKEYRVCGKDEAKECADFIIISAVQHESVLYEIERDQIIDTDKVLAFFDTNAESHPMFDRLIDKMQWKVFLLEKRVRDLERLLVNRINNIGYEVVDKYNNDMYQFPKIGKTELAIEKIVNEGCSLVRFGDGEFEIMAGKERAVFQKYDAVLSKRMRDVIRTKNPKLLVAIAKNYGQLDNLTDAAADAIREYMTDEVRKSHLSMLDMEKMYYDAYMFKTYFGQRDKSGTNERVKQIKRIWNDRDVVIIEGEYTRSGAGNDLFDNTKSVRRILAPTQNAFDVYDKLLERIKQEDRDSLLLVTLGPAAKVLVYDLVEAGFQVIDIGQVDMDYEWSRQGAIKRQQIKGKYVSQLPPKEIEEIEDEKYYQQIIDVIK